MDAQSPLSLTGMSDSPLNSGKQQQNLCAALAASKIVASNSPGAAASAATAEVHNTAAHHSPSSAAGAGHKAAGSHANAHPHAAPTETTSVKSKAPPPEIKNWIKHARLLFGVPTIAYTDA